MIGTITARSTTSTIVFFNDTATTEIYTLSLHDALPISLVRPGPYSFGANVTLADLFLIPQDRKSTRLNSSHHSISYAVFCLKKQQAFQRTDFAGPIRAGNTTTQTAQCF